jgi:Ca2+-binding RTX toxin-like protein
MGREVRPRRGRAGIRRFALLVSLVALAALGLALPGSASAATSFTVTGDSVFANGGPTGDHVVIQYKPDANGNPVMQVFDPNGIADPLPPGCHRKSETTVQCDLTLGSFTYDGGTGDDQIFWDFGLFFPFSARTASPFAVKSATPPLPTVTTDAGDGNDTIGMTGAVPTTMIGGPGKDTEMGGGGPDQMIGGAGDDHLAGNAGDDTIGGGPGNDKEKGGAGNDTLNCGGGKGDVVIGGPGKDKAKGCESGKA